jgi:hypothetical protein
MRRNAFLRGLNIGPDMATEKLENSQNVRVKGYIKVLHRFLLKMLLTCCLKNEETQKHLVLLKTRK